MISKNEEDVILGELVAFLNESERFTKQDLHNKYPIGTRDLELLLWDAQELVQKQSGIVFGPIKGWPGNYHRLTSEQIAKRAQGQDRAGRRKQVRAESKMRVAAHQAPDESKERLQRAADRMLERQAMARNKQI